MVRRQARAGLSLKARIIALFVAFAAVDLVTGALIRFINAHETVARDVRSAHGTAAFVLSELIGGEDRVLTANGLETLKRLPQHQTAIRLRETGDAAAADADPDISAPGWFIHLFSPGITTWHYQSPQGPLELVIDPRAQISRVWEEMTGTMVKTLLIDLEVALVIFLLTSRLLRPLQSYEIQLAQLEAGAYDIDPDPGNVPELMRIGARLRSLRDSLRRLEAENRDLATRLITVQDEERQYLAREIHDEIGPHVFAIRVDCQALTQAAEDQVRRRGESIQASAEHIHRLSRRILKHLRPMALDHLQLSDVLNDLVASWRAQQPEIDITLDITGELGGMSETVNVTVCRAVQEACLNAIRHASPGRVDIAVDRLAATRDHPAGMMSITVTDDGQGFAPDRGEGMGLSAMRQRVQALGGRLTITSAEPGGTRVEAVFPLDSIIARGDG